MMRIESFSNVDSDVSIAEMILEPAGRENLAPTARHIFYRAT
jgi:hypothetical protein